MAVGNTALFMREVRARLLGEHFDEGYKPRPEGWQNLAGEFCGWKPKPGAGYHSETDTATEWEQDQCVSGALGRGFALVSGIIQAVAATGGAATGAAARVYISGFNRSAAAEVAAARARAIARARQLAIVKAKQKLALLKKRHMVPTPISGSTYTRRVPFGR